MGADRAVALLRLPPGSIALDVGTGAGHTAHALARRGAYVVASDITPEMLAQVRRLAAGLGLANVQGAFALAEQLPFRDCSFDAVSCRLAAHHFRDVAGFCAQVARVLRPGGQALIIDVVVPEDEEAAAYINDIERHRDHSHVEDLPASAWRQLVEGVGLEVRVAEIGSDDLAEEELSEWTRRSGTAAEDIEYIRTRLAYTPPAVLETMSLRRDGDTFRWRWPVITIVAERSA